MSLTPGQLLGVLAANDARYLVDVRYRIIGPGRAGLSLDFALTSVGWSGADILGRADFFGRAAQDVDVLVLAVPDDAISHVAKAIDPGPAVVMHMAGSRTLDDLAPHERRGSIHPLMSLPEPEAGSRRLLDGCTFAVAGDPVATDMVRALGGRPIEITDPNRAVYHACAAVAANHGVALWAQVERLADRAGLAANAYWPLMRTSLEDAVETSAAAALTGPASRGDWATIRSHLAAIGEEEADLYRALAAQAAGIAGQRWPEEKL